MMRRGHFVYPGACRHGRCPRLAWHYDGKGIFSVKSSYKFFCDDIQRHSPRGSPPTSDQEGSCEEKFGS
jgi:hypothetical protein